MNIKDEKKKTAVQRMRERFYEIKKNVKSSPELLKAIRNKRLPQESEEKAEKKIASTNRGSDLDL